MSDSLSLALPATPLSAVVLDRGRQSAQCKEENTAGRIRPDLTAGIGGELACEREWLQCARRDPEHFLFFYEKYYESIYSFMFRLTRDQTLAEDLTSQAFFDALRRLDRFRWRGVRFGAWLHRIALNEWRLHHRRQRARREVSSNILELKPCPRPNALAVVLEQEQQTLVWECLQELDPVGRNIIVLFYWEDRSVQEMALILDMPTGTIKARLKRERDKLRRLILEAGIVAGSELMASSA